MLWVKVSSSLIIIIKKNNKNVIKLSYRKRIIYFKIIKKYFKKFNFYMPKYKIRTYSRRIYGKSRRKYSVVALKKKARKLNFFKWVKVIYRRKKIKTKKLKRILRRYRKMIRPFKYTSFVFFNMWHMLPSNNYINRFNLKTWPIVKYYFRIHNRTNWKSILRQVNKINNYDVSYKNKISNSFNGQLNKLLSFLLFFPTRGLATFAIKYYGILSRKNTDIFPTVCFNPYKIIDILEWLELTKKFKLNFLDRYFLLYNIKKFRNFIISPTFENYFIYDYRFLICAKIKYFDKKLIFGNIVNKIRSKKLFKAKVIKVRGIFKRSYYIKSKKYWRLMNIF